MIVHCSLKQLHSQITSQVTRPDDNKAIATCFHALLAGLRPVSLILARRIAVPMLVSGCWDWWSCNRVRVRVGPGTATGSLANARWAVNTATLLPNGKVLVAGGAPCRHPSAELYDPATGTWAATGTLASARVQLHGDAAAQRQGARRGGIRFHGYLASAELYDPATGTWSQPAPWPSHAISHTATLLPNGKVLVAGGFMPAALSPAWNSTTRPPAPGRLPDPSAPGRGGHTATLLFNGKVLVAGGFGPPQLFRLPRNCTIRPRAPGGPPAPSYRSSRLNIRLHCCLTARCSSQADFSFIFDSAPSRALYDPATGTWRAIGSLDSSRSLAHGDPDTRWPGPRRRRSPGIPCERGTRRSTDWHLDGHRQSRPSHAASHTATLLANGKVLRRRRYS